MLQRVQNTRIKNYFIDILKLNPIQDVIPDYVRQDIQPVVEVDKRENNIVRRVTSTNATSSTIFTTPTDKDFYLTGASLSMIRDATATSTQTRIVTTLFDGTACSILSFPGITLTANSKDATISFAQPVKLARGVTITVTNTTNVANIVVDAIIYGYTDIIGGV